MPIKNPIIPFIASFSCFFLMVLLSAQYPLALDTDEVFNYWEPLAATVFGPKENPLISGK